MAAFLRARGVSGIPTTSQSSRAIELLLQRLASSGGSRAELEAEAPTQLTPTAANLLDVLARRLG